ncbi:MAG: GCN5-related N-acetyltransferase [Ilumatobacteraceae bacterium]|nr:GCN5-related N-acetyltransferase [Ilumatobacteraceae bacterium]
MSTAPAVVDNTERHRLEVHIDGHVAHLDYTLHDGRLRLVHTEVPEELGGRGLGGILAQTALDKAIAGELTVEVICPFVKSWLEKHPDAAATVTIV